MHVASAFTVGTACGPSLWAAGRSEALAATPQSSAASDAGQKQAPLIQIGILLGTFAGPTLEARLDAVKACGLDCVQVSLDCAGLSAMPEEISSELAGRIRPLVPLAVGEQDGSRRAQGDQAILIKGKPFRTIIELLEFGIEPVRE